MLAVLFSRGNLGGDGGSEEMTDDMAKPNVVAHEMESKTSKTPESKTSPVSKTSKTPESTPPPVNFNPNSSAFELDVVFSRQKEKYNENARLVSCRTSVRKICKNHTPYFIITWTIYMMVSLLAVLDRFLWNVMPRQQFRHNWSLCQKQKESISALTNETVIQIDSNCGNDFDFSASTNPWSVQLFDILSRISGRLIITTTSLAFLTMCHCSWNSLASLNISWLKRYLNNWKQDNKTLHMWGGYVLGVCTVIHVWSLFLPSIFDGFTNYFIPVNEGTRFYPLQISLGNVSQLTIGEKHANWGIDDICRLFAMTIMFCALFPLSRAAKALEFNYSLMMWLHVLIGMCYFFDSWRRSTHPHVWLFNTPFVIWYITDRIAGLTCYHVAKGSKVRVFRLDDDYQVLMWQHKNIKSVSQTDSGDIYWMKSSKSTKLPTASYCDKSCRQIFEWSHPFTTASVMYTADFFSLTNPSLRDRYQEHRVPTIESPSHIDQPGWEGHRFRLDKIIAESIARRKASGASGAQNNWRKIKLLVQNPLMKLRPVRKQKKRKTSTCDAQRELHNLDITFTISSPRSNSDEDDFCVTFHAPKETPASIGEEEEPEVWSHGPKDADEMCSMSAISEETTGKNQKLFPVSEISAKGTKEEEKADEVPKDAEMGRLSTISEEPIGKNQKLAPVSEISAKGTTCKEEEKTDGVPNADEPVQVKSVVGLHLKSNAERKKQRSLVQKKFKSSRFREAQHLDRQTHATQCAGESKSGDIQMEAFDKCIITKIYRNRKSKKSCLRSFFRRVPATQSWEPEGVSGTLAIDISGPYRSEYARLKSYLDPNIPKRCGPVMVIATGAGAGIALDTMSLIRGWNQGYGLRLHFPVYIYFSTYSLALMQFVSNSLLADPVKGVHVRVALTRQVVEEHKSNKKRAGDVQFARIDLKEAVENIEDERTCVFFCGNGAVNTMLNHICAKKGLAFYGSAVE